MSGFDIFTEQVLEDSSSTSFSKRRVRFRKVRIRLFISTTKESLNSALFRAKIMLEKNLVLEFVSNYHRALRTCFHLQWDPF